MPGLLFEPRRHVFVPNAAPGVDLGRRLIERREHLGRERLPGRRAVERLGDQVTNGDARCDVHGGNVAWIIDPQNETLTVLRWTADGYVVALTAGRTDRVRAEPFEAVELPVGVLFGDEEE